MNRRDDSATGDLFAPPSGKDLKREGIEQVVDNEPPPWTEEAVEDLGQYAREHRSFLFEEWHADWLNRGHRPPHHANAWGAVASIAARRKLIRMTGRTRPAKSSRNHAHRYAEWEPCQ